MTCRTDPADLYRCPGKFLIVGGRGLLGRALSRQWRAEGRDVVATDRESLDLSHDLGRWSPPVPPEAGGVAILCAAVTRSDGGHEGAASRFINVYQTIALGRRLVECGYFLVFPSTSLVFDGTDSFPPTGTRTPTPVTPYARDKVDTELGLSALTGALAIVRLTKVVHDDLAIIASWRSAIAVGRVIRPLSDYVCAPISLKFAVAGIAAIATARAAGTWHLSSRDEITYGDLARILVEREGFPQSLVQPIRAPAGLIQHLPLHAVLDAAQTETAFGLTMPLAKAALEG